MRHTYLLSILAIITSMVGCSVRDGGTDTTPCTSLSHWPVWQDIDAEWAYRQDWPAGDQLPHIQRQNRYIRTALRYFETGEGRITLAAATLAEDDGPTYYYMVVRGHDIRLVTDYRFDIFHSPTVVRECEVTTLRIGETSERHGCRINEDVSPFKPVALMYRVKGTDRWQCFPPG